MKEPSADRIAGPFQGGRNGTPRPAGLSSPAYPVFQQPRPVRRYAITPNPLRADTRSAPTGSGRPPCRPGAFQGQTDVTLQGPIAGAHTNLARGQQGQALSLAIILLAFAALVASPVLIYISSMLLGQLHNEDNTRAILAADAGVEAVMADLVRGADAVTTTYPLPVLSVNEFTPTITITTPTAQSTPVPTYQYFDPGVQDPSFAVVGKSTGYLIHLYNLQPSTATFTNVLNINWAYSPAGTTRIGVWFDVIAYKAPGEQASYPTEQPILDTGRSRGTDANNQTGQITLGTTPGVYTIVFYNVSGADVRTTNPFKPSGGINDTWIYTSSFKDFVITSTVGGTSLEAYVRQTPGFMRPPAGDWSRTNTSFVTNALTVQTMDRQ